MSWHRPLLLLLAGTAVLASCQAEMPASSDGVAVVDATLEQRVRDAALATYVHGMTYEIALDTVGWDGVPVLRQLLDDPTFPRRDNVVAMLGFLADDDVVRDLVDHLDHGPVNWQHAEDQRALMLVPHVLGHAARAGVDAAGRLLLDMTADQAGGGPLAVRAQASPRATAVLEDLVDSALIGLANAGDVTSRHRLDTIAAGTVVPVAGYRALQGRASAAIERFEELHVLPPLAGDSGLDGDDALDAFDPGQAVLPPPINNANTDNYSSTHSQDITFTNHTDVSGPISDSRVDDVMEWGNLFIGRGDSSSDVACCATLYRSGSGGTFGSSGDGLDTIDTNGQLNSVFSAGSQRVHVVNAINYCSGSGTNIVGCASTPGTELAVVRISGDIYAEAMLWIHEYGHNTGLGHHNNSNIMYGTLTGNNKQLTQGQCNEYHDPRGGGGNNTQNIGSCDDVDGDDVHDLIDNCPLVANFGQSAADECPDAGDPAVSVTGDCPGTLNLSVSGMNGNFQGFTADSEGSSWIPQGACALTYSGLGGNPVNRGVYAVNGQGDRDITFTPNANFCGLYVQLVDTTTCELSNVVRIPQ